MNKKAIYPGSFDPFTNGHLDIIQRAAVIRVLPYASITIGQKGEGELVDFDALKDMCFAFSDDGKGVQREALMREAMQKVHALGGMIADAGFADRLVCATCSHFCTAERQYRAPLELGTQRTPTAQWTVTGSGAVMLSGGPAAERAQVVLTHTTCGRVIDLGIVDQNNMGAAMAPAAADTIAAHLCDLGRSFADYDLVVTGDLGHLGRDLLIELLGQKGVHVDEKKLFDCGCEIFSPRQDTHAGGSGCGCAASMLCAHILPQLASGQLGRVLFMATGALLSPTSTLQGESIPGVAHAVVLEHKGETGK